MSQPPKWALRFLRFFCRTEYIEEIEGDLCELFEKRFRHSPKKARRQFFWDTLRTFRPKNIKKITNKNPTMYELKNYTKVYFRRFKYERIHYLVNMLGLALGFAVLFFILIYVEDEKTIDNYHSKADRIYRILEKSESPEEGVRHFSSIANPLSEALEMEFPEIEESARLFYFGSSTLRRGEVSIPERKYAYASREIFNILDFKILDGDPLKDFNSEVGIVLNKTTAIKLFGKQNIAGEIVEMPGNLPGGMEVLAVMEDMPGNSSYQFNAIYVVADFSTFSDESDQRWFKKWDSRSANAFVLFSENASPERIMGQKSRIMDKYFPKEIQAEHDFYFQNISEMHLGSNHLDAFGMDPILSVPYGNRDFVHIILLIGLLVIVIAALNYINLSSVQCLKRSKEAKVRKINGANVSQLRLQLFLETFLTLFFACIISFCMLYGLYPKFLEVSDKQIPFEALFSLKMIVYYVLAFVIIWLLSSLIPAIYYSRIGRNLVFIKSTFSGKGNQLRKVFVTLQYGISMSLIIGSIVLYQQLNFVQSKDLGFSNSGLLTLDINSRASRNNFQNIISGLLENPSIVNASASSRVPGEWKFIPSVQLSLNQGDINPVEATHYGADHRWLDTYNMELTQGNNFMGSRYSDSLKVIINERAVELLGLENPIGKTLWVSEDTLAKMRIIGVVKNFHFESLHKVMSPTVITSWNNPVIGIDYFTIKYSGNVADVIRHIEKVQFEVDPDTPAEINFLDAKWERYYQADISRSRLIFIATIISIFISVFGLFGLINFTVERKTKEIGIRKVLGATLYSITTLVLKDYLFLLLIAIVFTSPIAWIIMNDWLSDFAYRIDLSPFIFMAAFCFLLLVSLSVVIFRVLKLGKSNPTTSLRSD